MTGKKRSADKTLPGGWIPPIPPRRWHRPTGAEIAKVFRNILSCRMTGRLDKIEAPSRKDD